jgi:predicted nucleotidyltransferase
MLDKSTVVATATRYAEAVSKEFSPAAILLFGSYSNGTPNEESDIDIGVLFNGFSGDRRKANTRLWNIAYDISWDIEPHLLDIAHDPSGFAKYILATGQVVYRAVTAQPSCVEVEGDFPCLHVKFAAVSLLWTRVLNLPNVYTAE